jgi:hypothetical protein
VTTTQTAATATATQLLTPRPDDLERSWQRQRLLRLGEDAGWYTYLAGDALAGRFVLRLPDGVVRVLTRDTLLRSGACEARRDEPTAWIVGQAYGHGRQDLLERIGALPAVYDRAETARRLGVAEPTINAHTRSGRLQPLFHARRRRHYFADQIDAMNGDTAAAARWDELQVGLPATTRIDEITFRQDRPRRPLPVYPIAADHVGARNNLALNLAEGLGWLTFLAAGHDGASYTIEVAGDRLELPGFAVLPFVWGLGDAHGKGDKVAYR